VVNVEDIPELYYDENQRPIPHQPWRRGETAGCEDVITAPWRMEAQSIIERAAGMVGAKVLDVTWYLTQLVITLDDNYENVHQYDTGPEIDIQEPTEPIYYDPNDPNPEPIWIEDEFENDEIVYQRDEEAERDFQRNMYSRKDAFDPDDEPEYPGLFDDEDEEVSLFATEENRQDVVLMTTEELEERLEQEEQPVDMDALKIDTAALSTIAKAILDALNEVEDDLQILSRHEVILTSPGASDVLETQRQFDAFRGFDVIVETHDPFQSNRILRGKLLERNSMDLIINKKGRMVTIPLNFVKCVRLPPAKREKGVPRDAPF
jgi:ribosome maturation factor RimP